MKHKPIKAWAVVHWNGGIYADTVSSKRRDAVAVFKKWYGVKDKVWASDVKYGIHRAVRVTISCG